MREMGFMPQQDQEQASLSVVSQDNEQSYDDFSKWAASI